MQHLPIKNDEETSQTFDAYLIPGLIRLSLPLFSMKLKSLLLG